MIQEDVFLGTLTVKETMNYSAQMRLPTAMTKHKVNSIVEETIKEMGLENCADRLIGNWHSRGISSGEKKRLSIAIEILTQPNLLLLDEPTTGLDNAAAFFITQTLKNTAFGGRTVITSIHQPSSEVFALFDDLLLLSEGEMVYFGDAKMALQVPKQLLHFLRKPQCCVKVPKGTKKEKKTLKNPHCVFITMQIHKIINRPFEK